MTAAQPRPGRARIHAALRAFPRRAEAADGHRPAAVAVTVVAGPAVLLTRRASSLRAHAGQYALPGGRADPGETSLQAARRELAEELGMELAPGAVLGLLDDYVTRSGYVITPVVLWAGDHTGPLRPREAEVAEVFRIPFADLDVEPQFVAIPESDRPVIRLPLRGGYLHAPTAAVLHQFREVVLGGRHTRVAHLEQPVFAWR
ncbi:MAG: NUDIX domain-containing protein [Pseudonocardiaceae bacterium]|nr:NUDIX domain-containing protein [Pseudonocardiaceae bacterium]